MGKGKGKVGLGKSWLGQCWKGFEEKGLTIRNISIYTCVSCLPAALKFFTNIYIYILYLESFKRDSLCAQK